MKLPLMPPVEPMLARLARDVPEGDGFLYEPKWDGFRCIAFRDRDDVYLQSRRAKALSRYFPEIVEALRSVSSTRFVLDGEIVVPGPGGLDFVALLNRLHPASSRVVQLSRATPAAFVAFDLLALDDRSEIDRPFGKRRELLERALADARDPVFVTPSTDDVRCAREWFDEFCGAGLDGVVAKDLDRPYEPGKRSMIKVKHDYTADCVVAGFRWHRAEPMVGSLLLGLFDHHSLKHVGLAASFTRQRRLELLDELRSFVVPLEGHPWAHGFGSEPPGAVARLPGTASHWGERGQPTWVAVRPELVAEVAYDHVDGGRFRHGVRFRRWRPDRDPSTCTFEQLLVAPPRPFADVIGVQS